MADKLIPLCKLFENTSKAGQRYFSGNLTYTTKLLIFPNEDAKEGEPTWEVYISERTPKPRPTDTPGGLTGEIPATDYPPRRWTRKA